MSVRQRYYRLEGRTAIPCTLWDFAMASVNPTGWGVAEARVGRARVSTVFLGHDANPRPVGPAQIFETMIFGGPDHLSSARYETWDEAQAGHDMIVAGLRLLRAEAVDKRLARRREARHAR